MRNLVLVTGDTTPSPLGSPLAHGPALFTSSAGAQPRTQHPPMFKTCPLPSSSCFHPIRGQNSGSARPRPPPCEKNAHHADLLAPSRYTSSQPPPRTAPLCRVCWSRPTGTGPTCFLTALLPAPRHSTDQFSKAMRGAAGPRRTVTAPPRGHRTTSQQPLLLPCYCEEFRVFKLSQGHTIGTESREQPGHTAVGRAAPRFRALRL